MFLLSKLCNLYVLTEDFKAAKEQNKRTREQKNNALLI